jgi:hypothetical protein
MIRRWPHLNRDQVIPASTGKMLAIVDCLLMLFPESTTGGKIEATPNVGSVRRRRMDSLEPFLADRELGSEPIGRSREGATRQHRLADMSASTNTESPAGPGLYVELTRIQETGRCHFLGDHPV